MAPPTTSLPLSRDVALERLRREIAQRWRPGDRLPPIKELSRLLGMGQTNTHRAAQALAAEGVLVSRSRHGTYLRRWPDDHSGATAAGDFIAPTAGSRAAAGKRVLVLAAMNTVDPFMRTAVDALRDVLARAGMIIEAPATDVFFNLADPQLIEQCDALMLVQPSANMKLPQVQVPTVMLTTGVAMPLAYDVVAADSEQGGYLAGQFMGRAGVRRTFYVGVTPQRGQRHYDVVSETRLRGFEMGFGQPVADADRCHVHAYRVEHGLKAFSQYLALSDRPDGIFCASDDLALGVVYGSVAHGLVAGEDFKLIGFDGQQRGRELLSGPLTTVQVPLEAMGQAAGQRLLSRIAQPTLPLRRTLLSCSIAQGVTATVHDSSPESDHVTPASISGSLNMKTQGSHERRQASTPRGFTLIELLVVMSIISLLIAVLLPALSKARVSSQAAACLTQVRQIMLGAVMYSNDNKGRSPSIVPSNVSVPPVGVYDRPWSSSWGQPHGFPALSQSYVGFDAFFCPANTVSTFANRVVDANTPVPGVNRARGGYMWRCVRENGTSPAALQTGETTSSRIPMARFDIGQRFGTYTLPPSKTAFAGDHPYRYRSAGGIPTDLGITPGVHATGVNVAYFDGHGQFQQLDRLRSVSTNINGDFRVYYYGTLYLFDLPR